MPIYNAINNLKIHAPLTLPQATSFMSGFSPKLQQQIIAAIYIGRNHIHSDKWNEDIMLSVDYIDDIPYSDFAQIVCDKNTALVNYLVSLERCAKNEGFDLNSL